MRDEIMALDEDELQLEVARVKGWKVTGPHRLTPESEPYFRIVSPEGRTGLPRHFATARETLLYETPQYSREIAVAWPLLDELQPPNRDVQITMVRYGDRSGYLEVYVKFRKRPINVEFKPDELASAICKVYLMEKEVAE
jgi:hypothetical protein